MGPKSSKTLLPQLSFFLALECFLFELVEFVKTLIRPSFYLSLCCFILTATSHLQADSILATNFSGRTISGTTANNITWTTDGVQDPGSLSAVNISPGSISGLFATPDAAGVFAVSKNIETEGPWKVEIPIVLTVDQLTIGALELGINNFNKNGEAQSGVERQSQWTASLIGTSSGLIDTQSSNTSFFGAGTDNITISFSPNIVLTDTETYTLDISVQNTGSTLGNNVGITSLNLTAVPEPAHFAIILSAMIGTGVAFRRGR